MKKDMPDLTLETETNRKIEEWPDTSFDGDIQLSDDEKQGVFRFSEAINLQDTNFVLHYGSAAQGKIARFSENALERIHDSDIHSLNKTLHELAGQIHLEETPKSGFFSFLKKSKPRHSKTEILCIQDKIDKIADTLRRHQIALMKDITMLEQLYKLNITYYKEISMYILAGQMKLKKARTEELPNFLKKDRTANQSIDRQRSHEYADSIERFEKKLHDLKLTRMISAQLTPQIKLLQQNDTLISEKIQSVLNHTIPLWKNQMTLALGIEDTRQTLHANRRLHAAADKALKENVGSLKQSITAASKENKKGLADLSTLKMTGKELVKTLDEVIMIQHEAQNKRQKTEAALKAIEDEIKDKWAFTK